MKLLTLVLVSIMLCSCSSFNRRPLRPKVVTVVKHPRYLEVSAMIEVCASKLIDRQVKATDAFDVCRKTYRYEGVR